MTDGGRVRGLVESAATIDGSTIGYMVAAVVTLAGVVSALFTYIVKAHGRERDGWAADRQVERDLWDHERQAHARELQRADERTERTEARAERLSQEMRTLETTIRDRFGSTLADVARTLTDALNAMRSIGRD